MTMAPPTPIYAKKHKDNAEFERAVRRCIPSEFVLIAGQEDAAEAMESYNASSLFELPNTIGKEGGVATSALLQSLYKNVDYVVSSSATNTSSDNKKWLTCQTVLKEMYRRMTKAKFRSVPQISCSRPLNDRPFYIVPPENTGKRRALLIGIDFKGDLELRAPHNDVHNVQHFLTTKCGFHKDNIVVLKDDGDCTQPTKKNIEEGFVKMVSLSEPKDVLFVFYSGHGALVKDTSGDDDDGYNLSILPVDYKKEGNILDDYILKNLVKALPEGVCTTMLVDCCHSGNVGDLPYIMKATSTNQEIEPLFNTDTLQEVLEKEAAVGKAKEERLKAKEERRRQREIRKKQRDEEIKEAETRMAELAANPTYVVQQPPLDAVPPAFECDSSATTETYYVSSPEEAHALAAKFGATITIDAVQKDVMAQNGKVALTFNKTPMVAAPMPAAPTETTTETFEVSSEEEAQALAAKFGTAVNIDDQQKDVMANGGRVTLTFTKIAMPTTVPAGDAPTAKTFEVSSPEEAKALASQFGTSITIDEQQAAIMKQGGKVQLTFFVM